MIVCLFQFGQNNAILRIALTEEDIVGYKTEAVCLMRVIMTINHEFHQYNDHKPFCSLKVRTTQY